MGLMEKLGGGFKNCFFLTGKMSQFDAQVCFERVVKNHQLLLMAEILHHLGCINPVNNGINYLLTGAGFQPSTVVNLSW